MDRVTGEVVAVKSIKLASRGERGASLEDVTCEIELLRSLNHPNIVKYLGCMETHGKLHIILEYMESVGSLASIIKQWGALSEELAMVYIKQVLQGLEYLHGQGVVHREPLNTRISDLFSS
ncbi:hypothetical protein FOA52_007883 [Chlamydomonas sp. UWO 241]|nr:hypothetical protein FOA52_007883 [Chlamydomonas sp. UWO 241]